MYVGTEIFKKLKRVNLHTLDTSLEPTFRRHEGQQPYTSLAELAQPDGKLKEMSKMEKKKNEQNTSKERVHISRATSMCLTCVTKHSTNGHEARLHDGHIACKISCTYFKDMQHCGIIPPSITAKEAGRRGTIPATNNFSPT